MRCCVQTGSGYHIFDNGLNPKDTSVDASIRRNLGFIGFDYDAMGPGKLHVCNAVHVLSLRLQLR